jgi:hypothetical protein
MSFGEKTNFDGLEAEMARLLAGREPSQAALDRCAWLADWALAVRDVGQQRRIVISGRRRNDRFTVRDTKFANVPVIWMDRKLRFALTVHGMHNLGTRCEEKDDF